MVAAARPDGVYRGLISTFLILALTAQVATLAFSLVAPGRLRAHVYPFIEYPMYAGSHYENERVVARWLLQGVLADGSAIDISETSLHLSIWDFVLLTDAIVNRPPGNPQRTEAIRTLIGLVRERAPHADELKELQISNYPLKVTRHGGEKIPSEIVVTIPLGVAPAAVH
jgi:hypothetical protein